MPSLALAVDDSGSQAPSPILTCLEPARTTLSLSSWVWDRDARAAPRGDGGPVLAIPGFATSDLHMAVLRRYLGGRGHRAYGWGQGVNLGPTGRAIAGVRRRLEEIADKHGEAVALVGWSLGGVFARDLARERPDLVRRVVTLGSPFRLEGHEQSRARLAYHAVEFLHESPLQLPLEPMPTPLPVPSTALYSRTDGIVAWGVCQDVPGPHTENVEVACSHFGFPCDPQVLAIVADRLARATTTTA